MSGGNTGAPGADVQRFGQLNEFRAARVGAAQKNGDLKPNARVRASLRCLGAWRAVGLLLQDEVHEDSTLELVQPSRFDATVVKFIKS